MPSPALPFRRTALLALPALGLLFAAPALRADSITYDVTLSPTVGTYGGTGTLTVSSAPASSGLTTYSTQNGTLQGLSFVIDGQTFSPSGSNGAFVQFLDGKLYDITFAQTVGFSPDRFTLDTSGVYAFYYNNGQSESIGNMTAALAPAATATASTPSTPSTGATPEPASLLLLATALLGGGFFLLRRKRATQS